MADHAIKLMDDDKSEGTSNEPDELGNHCKDLWTEFSTSQYRKDKLDEIEKGRIRYKGTRVPKKFPWKNASNLSMGLEAIAIDNLEPRVKAQLIAEDQFVNAEPVGPEDVEHVEDVQEFAHWALTNNMDVAKWIKGFVHDLLMDGTRDVIPIWYEKEVEVNIRKVIPMFETADGREIEVPEELANNPQAMAILKEQGLRPVGIKDAYSTREGTTFKVKYESIPLADAFFPDTNENWEEQPYLRYIYPTIYELKDLTEEEGGPYHNITDDLVVDPGRVADQDKDQDQESKGVMHSMWTKEVRLLECYVKWENEWTLSTYAPDAGWTEVRRQPIKEIFWHGRKPVRRFRIYPESNESLGTGIPTKIKHFGKGIDDLLNMMIDNGTIEIMPYFFYETVPGFEMTNTEISPGGGVAVPKGAKVTFPNSGVKSTVINTFIDILLAFFERTLSLSDYTLGRESQTAAKGGETFGGMNLIVGEGNVKHQYQGEGLRDEFSLLIKDTIALYAQFMPLDAKQRIFENNQYAFKPLDALSIQGEYDFKIQISDSTSNKMLARKEAVEKMNLFIQNPTVDPVKLTEDGLRAYGVRTMSDYMKPGAQLLIAALTENPELPKVVQAYLQKKQAAARDQQIAGEASANVNRQNIERQVEAPFENAKLVDQETESAKRKVLKPIAEAALREGKEENLA